MCKKILNENKDIVYAIQEGLENTGGYCPCVPKHLWDEDTKCPCKIYKETAKCKCNLYVG